MSTIEVTFQAVVHMKGIGKSSGNPFDFAELRYVVPIQPVQKQNFQMQGYGAEVQTLPLENSNLIHQFAEVKPGSRISIEVGPSSTNLQRNVCHGLANKETKAA